MKTKYPSLFGLVAALLLVAAFVVPVNLAAPSPVEAAPGLCRWDYLEMPGSIAGKRDIEHCSEINHLVAGNDGKRLIATVTVNAGSGSPLRFYPSSNNGMNWSGTPYNHLRDAMAAAPYNVPAAQRNVWDVAIAGDNANFWVMVTSTAAVDGPVEIWVTEDGGTTWRCAGFTDATSAQGNPTPDPIGAVAVSMDYGGKRDIAVGLRTGADGGAFRLYNRPSSGFTSWKLQTEIPVGNSLTMNNADIFALMFSPTYVGDAALGVVFAGDSTAGVDAGTFFNIALRDLDNNEIQNWAYASNSIELKDTSAPLGSSPDRTELIVADLDMPSDFSGQSASLRRAYVSTDAGGINVQSGIYRVDDTTLYTLMNTTNLTATGKRIASIAYYGTYASGKLLAGEVIGQACTATVPTWFTDSPTVCPIPCWYPALKPTTGAAGIGCDTSTKGQGNAQVAWRNDGVLAYVGTGSSVRYPGDTWYRGFPVAPICDDESAFAISRNNGETWNQIGLIDTTIDWFNDAAVSADCTTLYLASVSHCNGTTNCTAFDSVWRSSSNPAVNDPLPSYELGRYYERVLTRVTALNCEDEQTDLPLLRLAPDKTDGEIVVWGAQNTRAQAWSPDFGDYWATINPRNSIQDFALESSTILYDLTPDGKVQKLPYTGTAWSTALAEVDTTRNPAHMIAARAEGKVLVGAGAGQAYPVSFSTNGGASFSAIAEDLPTRGNVHVAFDSAFDKNGVIYVGDDDEDGTVYRNTIPAYTRWEDMDMMGVANGAKGCPDPSELAIGQYGLQTPFTGSALYSAHYGRYYDNLVGDEVWNSGVARTIDDGSALSYGPLAGMPKPGVVWDDLNVYQPLSTGEEECTEVEFTLEPWSLKICGCLTLDTNTTLYALDDQSFGCFEVDGYDPAIKAGHCRQGYLWAFIDCMAKKGVKLISEDKMLIGCDPVSGRAQEVNLCWEQLCVGDGYDIEVAKNKEFTIKVLDWVLVDDCEDFFEPADVTMPCAYVPAGGLAGSYEGSAIAVAGNLECGHTYYWRVQVRQCATGQVIRSPWSEVRSFQIKAGLPVSTPYYGPQLLAPNNGCIGCPVSPVSFSWSPYKESTGYKFVLASDSEMKKVVVEQQVTTTAYEYEGKLDYGANYFWRVMAVTPAPSDWSATFSFQTAPAPAAPPAPEPAPGTPLWVWVVIAIGAILVIVTLVLIFKTRRV